MVNPWNIQSIYELQYFRCPSCVLTIQYSKQELINHACECHPESIEYLNKINDNSLIDVFCPWNELITEIKFEETALDGPEIEKIVPEENFKTHDGLNTKNVVENSVNSEDRRVTEIEIEETVLNRSENELIEPDVNTKGLDKSKTQERGKSVITEANVMNFSYRKRKDKFGNLKKKCSFCELSFVPSSLQKHIEAIHLKIKKYKCEICEKSFTQSQTLKNHIKSKHPSQFSKIYKEDITYFECDHCSSFFLQKSVLNIHIETVHKNARNYHCKYCSKTFTQLGSINQHLKVVHKKQKLFKCPHCTYEGGKLSNLKSHVKSNH